MKLKPPTASIKISPLAGVSRNTDVNTMENPMRPKIAEDSDRRFPDLLSFKRRGIEAKPVTEEDK